MKACIMFQEYPFYTISTLPDGVLTHIGGLVTARSVKLLDKINNPDDPETRDAWWTEVRDEMRSHLRVLGCSVIIGYSESTSICDSLCVFSATGTAVTVTETSRKPPTSPGSETELKGDTEIEGQNTSQTESPARSPTNRLGCSLCHLPYSTNKLPVDIKATFCRICRSRQVPSLILSTSGLPTGMPISGRGCLVQARVCVAKRKMKGEENAYKVSKELPFLEYEIHSRLLNKVYVHGMNAVFGVKIQVSVGDTVITGLATGTAVYLEALPPPPQLTFHSKEGNEKASAATSSIQVTVDQALKLNRKIYGLLQAPVEVQVAETGNSFVSVAEDTPTDPDLTTGKKDVFLVDLSNLKIDGGNIHTVVERPLPEEYLICNLSSIPGTTASTPLEGKMVTIVKKYVFQEQRGDVDRQFSELLLLLIQTLCFKVRTLRPCTLTELQFDVDLPEEDEIQVSVTAVVARSHHKPSNITNVGQNRSSDEFIFDMDEGQEVHHTRLSVPDLKSSPLGGGKIVLMTPSPFITGWTVQKYLGRINVFLIRESTSIRESGGIGIFLDLFLLEANSIVRANVKAVGGNAILNYQLNKCVLIDHHYKNQ
ncbi:C2 domain-containing protein 5, partial [Geodia barretti]